MKKRTYFFNLITAFLVVACVNSKTSVQKPYNVGLNIIPMPMELSQNEGFFELTHKAVFVSNDTEVDKIAAYFAGKIKNSTGYSLDIVKTKPASNFVQLSIVSGISVNEEGYLLDVSKEFIEIQAKTLRGLFYGMQTIMQLLPAEIESPIIVKNINWEIPCVSIKDEPRFKYRGMHLDVCRHFFDIDFIKKQLDVLAMFKINKFHWHLTDDQAWRIEIKKYPHLMEVGTKRIEGEGNTYGPYYFTQEQVKEVVAYAKERFIEVIPEIELPGHAVAAIHAYPELSCTELNIPVRNIWGVATDVFCAGKETTFEFLENVLKEVIPLFESDYIHIGGDECPKLRWKNCPHCQARIKELGLKSDGKHSVEEMLQSYFVQRIEKFLLQYNKKIIGWDEILEGGLAPTATVMSWQGENGGIAAANMGHDVIMTPGGWFYLDKYQGSSKLLNVTIGGYLPLEKIYNYDPIPERIEEDKKHHILGAQCNLWAEYKYTSELMEHDIYPRVIAAAELNWTPKEKKNYSDFERRIDNQRVRLDMHDINYYIPIPQEVGVPSCNHIAFTDNITLEFETTEPVTVVYTTDGKEPDASSKVYSKPLVFNETTTLKLRSILLSGKMGKTRTINIEKQSYSPSVNRVGEERIKAEYFKGKALTFAELENRTPDETEYIQAPVNAKYKVNGYYEVYEEDLCSAILTGYINIPEDGVYYFSTDGEFWLDNKLFISNEKGNEGTARRFSRSDRSIALAKGYHPFKLVRLGAIFGGWPTQWDSMNIQIRKSDEEKFKSMDRNYFQ